MTFFKYQSLGNDFVVFDWYKESEPEVAQRLLGKAWIERVIALCSRYTGVGADGVLVLTQNNKVPLMRIFNADGTEAENCLNGVRCIAQHLADYHKQSGDFLINIKQKSVLCSVSGVDVNTVVPFVKYQGAHALVFSGGILHGHLADAGNPHFMVFKETSFSWLVQHGKELECHRDFPYKANVSFVWPDLDAAGYRVLTFERGCGITQACSSAASAILKTLVNLGRESSNKAINLRMLGGVVSGCVDTDGSVILQARAMKVFQGELFI